MTGVPVEAKAELPEAIGMKPAVEAPPEPKKEAISRDWDKYYEDLVGDLDSFAPARETGKRNYEMDDVAKRFVDYAKSDNSGKTLIDLVKDFSKYDDASASQIRKLRDSVKSLESDMAPPEPTKQAEFAGYMLGQAEPSFNIPGVKGRTRTVSAKTAQEAGYTVPEKIPTQEEWKTQQTEAKTTAAAVEKINAGEHPGGSLGMTVPAGQKPGNAINIARRKGDYGILNRFNSPQFLFYFGKFGDAAKKAWETMALGEFKMRESISRDVNNYVTNLRASLPKPFRKQSGKLFFDVLDGKTIQEIEAAHPDQPKVVDAAKSIKDRLEVIRQDIRDIKSTGYSEYLNTLSDSSLQDLYTKNINPTVPAGIDKAGLVKALADAEYPADWGIADGTYLPHLFSGTWRVTVTDPSGTTHFFNRAKTPQEAKVQIAEAVKNNPQLANAEFNVEQDMSIPPDVLRLFDKRLFKMVNALKDNLGVSVEEIRDAQRGIIGRKAGKQKWFGSLKERFGYEGYSKDFDRVLTSYLSGYHRWKNLTAMQREVMPLIEKVKTEYPHAAQRLEGLMENLWASHPSYHWNSITRSRRYL